MVFSVASCVEDEGPSCTLSEHPAFWPLPVSVRICYRAWAWTLWSPLPKVLRLLKLRNQNGDPDHGKHRSILIETLIPRWYFAQQSITCVRSTQHAKEQKQLIRNMASWHLNRLKKIPGTSSVYISLAHSRSIKKGKPPLKLWCLTMIDPATG